MTDDRDLCERLTDPPYDDTFALRQEAADEIERLGAENERLRGVLERIADTDPDEGTAWFHEVARAALAKQ